MTGDLIAQAANFTQLVVEELLATKTWLNSHDQDHVELREDVEDRLNRLGWANGEASLRAHVMQLACQAHRSVSCSHVEGDRVSAVLGELRCPTVRVFDHQVHIGRKLGHFANALDDWLTNGEVRDEMMVHHVDMHKVGGMDGVQVALQVAKISGQNTWCNANAHTVHSIKALD